MKIIKAEKSKAILILAIVGVLGVSGCGQKNEDTQEVAETKDPYEVELQLLEDEIAEFIENGSDESTFDIPYEFTESLSEVIEDEEFISFMKEQAQKATDEGKYNQILEVTNTIGYMEPVQSIICEKLQNTSMDLAKKCSIIKKGYLTTVYIDVSEVIEFLKTHELEKLYFAADEGGYYDNADNQEENKTVYGKYATKIYYSYEYYGDFATEHQKGDEPESSQNIQAVPVDRTYTYFRGIRIYPLADEIDEDHYKYCAPFLFMIDNDFQEITMTRVDGEEYEQNFYGTDYSKLLSAIKQ